MPVGHVEGDRRGGDRPAQQRGVHDVGSQAGVLQLLPAALGLGPALVAQGYVDPAGEEVLGVPDALAVAQQDEGVRHAAQPSPTATQS